MYPKVYADYFRQFDRTPEVFIGMPFAKGFEARWRKIFKPAIASLSLKAHTHKFRNDSGKPCVLLALGVEVPHHSSEYPDSEKVAAVGGIYRKKDRVGYWEGE